MKMLFSKVNPGELLHLIASEDDFGSDRKNLTPEHMGLQAATIRLKQGQTFKPHRHIKQIRTTEICEEAWVVLNGNIEVTHYDLDDTILETNLLSPGDCTITFKGGHNYKAVTEGARVFEFKTGPYQGQKKDKVFIDG